MWHSHALVVSSAIKKRSTAKTQKIFLEYKLLIFLEYKLLIFLEYKLLIFLEYKLLIFLEYKLLIFLEYKLFETQVKFCFVLCSSVLGKKKYL